MPSGKYLNTMGTKDTKGRAEGRKEDGTRTEILRFAQNDKERGEA
jgi:hypothetical protein